MGGDSHSFGISGRAEGQAGGPDVCGGRCASLSHGTSRHGVCFYILVPLNYFKGYYSMASIFFFFRGFCPFQFMDVGFLLFRIMPHSDTNELRFDFGDHALVCWYFSF